jgi:hypothetical protein
MFRTRAIMAVLLAVLGLGTVTACKDGGDGPYATITVKGTVDCGKFGTPKISASDLAINRTDIEGRTFQDHTFTLVMNANHFKHEPVKYKVKVQCGHYDVIEHEYVGVAPQIVCNYNSCKQTNAKPPKPQPAANVTGNASCRGGGHPTSLKLLHDGWHQTIRTYSYNSRTGDFKGYVSHRNARGYAVQIKGCNNTKSANAGPYVSAHLKIECYKGKYTCKVTK